MEYAYLSKEALWNNLINLPQVTFEVTDACNLKCKYCGYGELYGGYDERSNKKMSVNKAIVLLKYLCDFWESNQVRSYRKNTYISFYGGEPLLNIDFIKNIVEWIEKVDILSCKFVFTMTTNAVFLDRYIDYLVQHNFYLLISLDGNEAHNDYRVDHAGNSSYKKVYNNIRLIKEKYPDFFNNHVSFSSVLHNKNNYNDLLDFFYREFGKKPLVSELNPCGVRPDKKHEYGNMYNNKNENINNSLDAEILKDKLFMDAPETAFLCSYLFWHSGNVFQNYKDLLIDKNNIKWYPTGTCLPFERKIFVTVNGRILPCERVSHEYDLGFVDDENVVLDVENIVKKYNSWMQKYMPQCEKCYNHHTCKQCMFYNPDLKGEAKCSAFMNKKDFEQYQATQYKYLAEHPSLYKKIMTEVIIH